MKIDDEDASIGTKIEIYVNEEFLKNDTVKDAGEYLFYVSEAEIGDDLKFRILNQLVGTSTVTGTQKILDFNLYTDRDGDETDDSQDKLIGDDGNDIDHNYDDLNLFINDSDTIESTYSGVQTIKIYNDDQVVLEFEFDFDDSIFNLFDLELKKIREMLVL